MLSSGLIPRRLNFVCQRFGTLCLFHLHRRVGMKNDWGRECWDICPNIPNPSHSSFGIYSPTFPTPAILHLGYMPQHSQPQPFFIWDICPNILNPSHSSFGIYIPKFSTPVTLHTYPPMKMEQCSETSAYKIQTQGNYPEESI